MISVGDLVECEEMKRAWPTAPSAHWLGLVFKVKTQSLDGINEEKMYKVHFPNRQQYWILSENLNKIA